MRETGDCRWGCLASGHVLPDLPGAGAGRILPLLPMRPGALAVRRPSGRRRRARRVRSQGRPAGGRPVAVQVGRGWATEAGARLTAMLDGFLREHSDQVWQAAGMDVGPELAAIVPSGQGRLGPHPLLGIVASCVDVPIVPLSTAPGAAARA